MLKINIRFTPEQLQAKLDAAFAKAHYVPAKEFGPGVDTLVNYRYAKVLANTGPYTKFVKAYIQANSDGAPSSALNAASVIMNHAVTEMRRAYQHHGQV